MIEVNFTGLVIATLPERSGVSQRGAWRCASYVMEYTDMQGFPTKLCFDVFGDERIEQLGIKVGATYNLHCYIESKEFNERWFTSIKCVKAERVGAPQAQPQPQAQPKPHTVSTPPELQEAHNQIASEVMQQIKSEAPEKKENLFPDDLPF